MATRLGRRYDVGWWGRPEGMPYGDWLVWQEWRSTGLAGALGMYFNVGLGEGGSIPSGTPEHLAAMWRYTTQKRADVVVVFADSVALVELRANASSSAVGRLLQYGMLWAQDPVVPGTVRLVLVTDHEDAELRALCDAVGVELNIVPAVRLPAALRQVDGE